MAITVATDNEAIDEDSFTEDEEETSYSYRELMDLLIDKRDIIITIPIGELEALKKGLYTRKGKDVQKLSRAGIKSGNEVLSFLTYHPKDAEGNDNLAELCVRVRLGARKSVTVLKIEVPDDTF